MEHRILTDRDVWTLVAAGHLNLRGAVLDGVNQETATAVLDVNQQAKLDGLRAALVVLAAVALLALFAARRISTQQTGSTTGVAFGLPGAPGTQER